MSAETAAPTEAAPAAEKPASEAAARAADASAEDASFREGRVMTFYSLDEKGGDVIKRKCKLWYEPKAESDKDGMGTLRWRNEDSETKEEDSIPLKKVRDVFLGKQTKTFKHASLAAVDASLCFSIGTSQKDINVENETVQQRNSWLVSLKKTFEQSNKKVQKKATESTNANAPPELANLPSKPDRSEKHASEGENPVLPDKESIRELKAGRDVIAYFAGENPKQDIHIWLRDQNGDGRLGTLCWNDAERKKQVDEEKKIPIHRIRDVYVGKQTAVLNSVATSADENRCFSIMTSKRELDIEESSQEARAKFLANLRDLLSTGSKKVEDQKVKTKDAKPSAYMKKEKAAPAPQEEGVQSGAPEEEEPAPAAAAPLPKGSGSQVAGSLDQSQRSLEDPVTEADLKLTPRQYLEKGRNVTAWSAAEPKKKLEVSLFLKGDTLYWDETNQFHVIDKQGIKLAAIKEVFLGKQTPELKEAAKTSAVGHCFSLLTSIPTLGLHVEEVSKPRRDHWLSSLKGVLVESGKDVRQPAKEDPVILEGMVFSAYFADAPTKKQRIQVWFSRTNTTVDHKHGSFYWCFQGEPKEKHVSKQIAMDRVKEVFLGKQTPTLKALDTKEAPFDQCFSILAKNQELNLVADTAADRIRFLAAMKTVLTNSGKSVQERGKASPRKAQPVQVDANILEAMRGGLQFIWYHHAVPDWANSAMASTTTLPTSSRVHVYYDDKDPGAPSGKLVVCNPSPFFRVSVFEGKSLPVDTAARVVLLDKDGKQLGATLTRRLETDALDTPNPKWWTAQKAGWNEAHKYLFNIRDLLNADADLVHSVHVELWTKNGETKVGSTDPILLDSLDKELSLRPEFESWVKVPSLPGAELRIAIVHKAGDPLKTPRQTLIMNNMKEVYFGKQTEILMLDELAGKADDKRCFTLLSTDVVLDLEAETHEHRQAWLYGIHQILSSAGKMPFDPQDETPVQSEASSALSTKDSDTSSAAGSLPADTLAIMETGDIFTSYVEAPETKEIKVRRIRVWYSREDSANADNKSGVLFWKQVESTPDETFSVSLNLITDMYFGKQTSVLESPAAANAPDQHCFAMLTKNETLHLEADSEEKRNRWFFGVYGVLTSSGMKVVDDDEDKVTTATNSKMSEGELAHKRGPMTDDALESGAPPDAAPIECVITVKCRNLINPVDSGDGSDAFSKANPIVAVNDVDTRKLLGQTEWIKGSHDPVFETKLHLTYYPGTKQSLMFSVYDRDSDRIREEDLMGDTIVGFDEIVTHAGQDVRAALRNFRNTKRDAKLRHQSSCILIRVEPIAPDASFEASEHERNEAAVKLMRDGTDFTSYYTNDSGAVLKEDITVWYEIEDKSGLLYWGAPGSRVKSPDRVLALDTITDLYMGKQTEPLKDAVADPADDPKCLAIVSSKGTDSLHLEAASNDIRDMWLDGITYIMTSAGKHVVDKEKSELKPFVPTADVAVFLSPEQLVGIMKRGRTFRSYNKDGSRSMVILYYNPDEPGADFGSFCWVAPEKDTSPRKAVDSDKLLLNLVTDVYIGKFGPLAQDMHTMVPQENCFTISAQDKVLTLEASCVEDAQAWLLGLSSVLHGPRYIVEEKTELPFARHYSVHHKTRDSDAGGKRDDETSYLLAHDAPQILRYLHQPSKFTGYFDPDDKYDVPRELPIEVSYDADGGGMSMAGRLFWRADGASDEQLRLDDVKRVLLGKQTPVLQWVVPDDVSPHRCASIETKDSTFNVSASTEEQLAAWLFALSCRLNSVNRRIELHEETVEDETRQSWLVLDVESSEGEDMSSGDEHAVAVAGADAGAGGEKKMLAVEDEPVCAAPDEDPVDEEPTSPKKKSMGEPEDEGLQAGVDVDVDIPDDGERTFAPVKRFSVVEFSSPRPEPLIPVDNGKLASLISAARVELLKDDQAFKRIMIRGRKFIGHSPPTARNEPTIKELFVFWAPDESSKHGVLYYSPDITAQDFRSKVWENPAWANKMCDQCINLEDISEIKLGKSTNPSLADVPSEHCFTLVTKDGQRMEFQAESMEQVLVWTVAVTVTCNGEAMKAPLDDSEKPPVDTENLEIGITDEF